MLQTVWAEKVDKKWRDLSSFDVPILSYGPQIVWKNAVFCNFVLTTASKKSKSMEEMYIYASEIYIYASDCFLCYDLLCWRY